MKKNKFLALTMLCSVLSGVSANAQEVKNSGSQTTGEVKNSSGNKGTSNSDKNVEKITKKAPNSKKVEGGNSSGSKKSDVKKGDKEVTKDKAKDSGKVGWEDFKKRFGDRVSSFFDLVKRHPVLSSIIGICGGITIEEGVRRTCFKPKNNNPPKNDNSPENDNPPPKNDNPPPVGIWGVDKFGYKEDEDCIYRNPDKKKIRVILVGSTSFHKSFNLDKHKDELIKQLKVSNHNSAEYLKMNEEQITSENLKVHRVKYSNFCPDGEDISNIIGLSKVGGPVFVVFAYSGVIDKILEKSFSNLNLKVKKLVIGENSYENVDCCNKLTFQCQLEKKKKSKK